MYSSVRRLGARMPLLAMALAFALLLAPTEHAPRAFADTWYVATNGDDGTGDGSAARPFATIGHALNNGIPAAGGGEVVVRDGAYHGTSTIRRGFPLTVTLRAEHPYRAMLSGADAGREAIRVYVAGAVRLRIEGFVLSNRHPEHVCDGREPYYLVHLQDASNVVLADNILFGNNAPGTCNELLKINRGSPEVYPRGISVRGNVFYEPANAGGADLIDAVRPGEVAITDNIFFSDPGRDRSQSFITLKRQAPASEPSSPRYHIARNVFLGWGGKADQAFVQFGEDGVPEHEITDALIENNLFLGDSPARMAAPIQLKGAQGVIVRANTVVGDLPSGAFGFRIGTEGDNPTVGEIDVFNNVWSDPTGTMGSRFLNAYGDVDLSSIRLRHNLFWNGGEPLPSGGDLPPTADSARIVSDPLLGAIPEDIVLPIWNAESASFASGAGTIREEFLRLVEAYGAPDAASPVVDAADLASMPADDIRGWRRDARPDIGAYELGAEEAGGGLPPDEGGRVYAPFAFVNR